MNCGITGKKAISTCAIITIKEILVMLKLVRTKYISNVIMQENINMCELILEQLLTDIETKREESTFIDNFFSPE